MKDEDIVLLLRNPRTKNEGFTNMVRKYQQQLYWQIRKMLISHDDTDDVLQNTLMKAWTGIDNFRGDSKVSTWLYRIAVNETLTFLNNQRMKFVDSMVDMEDVLLSKLESDPYFDGDELELKLQKAILALPDKQRLVFNMRYYEEKSYEQMSEILGTSEGALKASYHHAVKKIERFFDVD